MNMDALMQVEVLHKFGLMPSLVANLCAVESLNTSIFVVNCELLMGKQNYCSMKTKARRLCDSQ